MGITRRIEEYFVEFIPVPRAGVQYAFDMANSLMGAVLIVFILFTVAVRAVGVEGSSMKPTLSDGDWLAITSNEREFARGDIIVVTQPWERNVPIIKRVIGTEGDIVDIDFKKGEVYVNGELLEEDYILEKTHEKYDIDFPVTVGKGEIFAMGDNRNGSLDCRSSKIGMVDTRFIMGKAVARIYPHPRVFGGKGNE